MGAQSLSLFDASLKDFYEGKVRQVLNRQVRLLNYARKGQKTFTGRQVLFPVNVQGSTASAFIGAGVSLPTAQPQVTTDVKIPIKEIWGRIQVLHDVIEAARDDRGAFERPVALEIKRMAEDMADRMNRAAFGVGDGKIGEVFSRSSQVVTCRSLSNTLGSGVNGNAGNRYIKSGNVTNPGDTLDVYASDGTTSHGTGLQVTAHSVSNNTITVVGTTTAAVGDGIFIAHPDGTAPATAQAAATIGTGDPMGLAGLIDDGTFVTTLHNISRTTFGVWKANVILAGTDQVTPAALTLDMMQRAVDLASEAGMGFPGVGIAHYSIRREYIKLVQTDRRYIEKFTYDPGIEESHMDKWPWPTSLDFDGFPIVFEKHCPWRTMYFLDPRVLRKWVLKEFHWVQQPGGGGGSMYLVPGKAGLLEAQAAAFYNLGTDEVGPSSSSVIKFISESNLDRSDAAMF